MDSGRRSLDLSFRPGPFAGPLIAQMGLAGPGPRLAFRRLAEDARRRGAAVTLVVNGETEAPGDEAWPADWRQLDLRLRRSPAVVNTEDDAANDAETGAWAIRFTGLVLALVPVERLDETTPSNA